MPHYFAATDRSKLAIAFLRISTGILFAIAAWRKISAFSADPGWSDRMVGFINAQQNTPDWWRGFLDSYVIPNADLFAYLTAYGEAAIAVALILGFLARPATFFAILFALSTMFTKGTDFWTPSSNDTLYVLVLVALFFMKPGETLGIDEKIKYRLLWWPT